MGINDCVECSREVSSRQHALSCDICSSWQHRICNTGISLDVYRAMVKEGTDIPFICSKCKMCNNSSLQEPELLDSVLPDTAVTFTLVEQGSQRARAKLVSSDGYEYTRKVSKGNFTYWRCSKRSKAINCPASGVTERCPVQKEYERPHSHRQTR
ncbi:PREDICTED: uncharacterized protein LOC106818765, partial [Priapulus caudatus]|uniref:Uncharacterized protein LOC106818765 n=1 Tax=Priapulus caudatus TaxID=37621 RepID=A0ABM1F3A3_PRICU